MHSDCWLPKKAAGKPAMADYSTAGFDTRHAVYLLGLVLLLVISSEGLSSPRARDLGVPFDGETGPYNAITDVPGVLVGHTTLNAPVDPGEPNGGRQIRTGVTAILPLGYELDRVVAAGRAVINGTGEMTGSWLIDEIGGFVGPVMMTGTTSVGRVHHATSRWIIEGDHSKTRSAALIPVIAETLDSHLHDVWGDHLSDADVYRALDSAVSGPVAEGNVGGGTGMIAYAFKGGIGTSSRVVRAGSEEYTIGVMVQANHGNRESLTIAGTRVGAAIPDLMPAVAEQDLEKNSLVIIIATDAPLAAHQLNRIARRASLGVGRLGSTGGYMSGEIVLAFSTTNTFHVTETSHTKQMPTATHGALLNALFKGTVEATEEAIVNSLVAAETMTGNGGLTVHALPEERLKALISDR